MHYQHVIHPYISLLIIREDHLEMSDSGTQPKAASGRMLDDGSSSEGKEMGNGNGMIASNSKDLLRRLMRASVDSDRRHTLVAPGKLIRKCQ